MITLHEFTPLANLCNRQASPFSDSVKRHLPIGYAADLTPVVAAKEAEVSWNARGMAETVFFHFGRNTATGRQGGHPERLPDTSKDTRGGDQLVFGERATNQ